MSVTRPTDDAVLAMERSRARTFWVLAACGLGYGGMLLRACELMLIPDDRLQAKAAEQFQHAVQVDAPRGDILGADGTLLATDVEMPSVHADPASIPPEKLEPLVAALAPLVELDPLIVRERLSKSARRDIVVAQQIDPTNVELIEELDSNGAVWVDWESARYYPGRELAASVLGVVGRSGSGLEGVEKQFDRYLRGSTFRFIQQQDRRGRAISPAVEARSRAQSGDVVQLTVDPVIQRAVEDALDHAMVRSAPEAATAVVLDAKTGAILAMSSRPTTNPNDRRRDTSLLRNRAVADAHEPGSIAKPFVMALALEEGITTPDALIDCEGGSWGIGRSRINDDHPHGVVTATEVIKYSSNIGTAKLAFQLGAEKVISGMKRFGFAQPTGAALPSEVFGFLRRPDKIRPIELATTAFGQGMTATALQLAVALQGLVNDGERMRPYLVSEVRDRHGEVKLRNRPEKTEQVVSEKVSEQTRLMMATVLDEGGTGTKARIKGYSAGGKTGTAQKVVDGHYSPTARVSSFIGFAPVMDPAIVVVVMVDTPHQGSKYGGLVSGPVFSEIGERALRHLGVPQDALSDRPEPPPEPVEEARPAEAELVWVEGGLRVPDLTGLGARDLLATFDGAGVAVSMSGSGRVVEQSPAPGAVIRPGDSVIVRFQ